MLRTTMKISLALMLVLLVIALTGSDSYAAIGRQKRQVKSAPAKQSPSKPSLTKQVPLKSAPIKQVRKVIPVPDNAAKVYVQKVNAFLKDPRWQPGTTYNGSQKPKLSKYGCSGCCAYAADFVQYVFGKDSPRSGTAFNTLGQIRAGDVVVLSNPSHWIVVLARTGNSLETLEGNWMGKAVREKGAYTLNRNAIMRGGKKFRAFSMGYHFR